VANNNAAHLVLGYSAVHNDAETQQDPRQVRRLEHEQTQEAEHGVWVLAAPDVDQRAAQGTTEEGHAEHGRNA
jgi:hypothetical protein